MIDGLVITVRCEHSGGLERSASGVQRYEIKVTLNELVAACPKCVYFRRQWTPQVAVSPEAAA